MSKFFQAGLCHDCRKAGIQATHNVTTGTGSTSLAATHTVTIEVTP